MNLRRLLPLLFLTAAGCVTARPTNYSVPKERASECGQICADLGMRLSAVVVIMSSAGCVCEPQETSNSPQGTSGAAAAGGAAIQVAVEAAQQQQRQAAAAAVSR